ncbi:MAG: arsenate reductase [Alphaproteobacteria bacterium]|nr:arsenate reductase [Alphaproteobacteria bacterium]MCY4232113.1 arsenate reductase [Alphaproteobacteria bacterium]MCY4319687.1 arsenate reductase [Alphaproteobacteria bacterium]
MLTVYGLKTCDACRKARKAVGEHRFHDLREHGLDAALLDRWIAALGWQALLNRRSTTWRSLDETDRAGLDASRARGLMLAHPALVKRPVIDDGGTVRIGV